jgi:trimeric autotransporter adhesin
MIRPGTQTHEKSPRTAAAASRCATFLFCCLAAASAGAYAQIVIPSSGDISTIAGTGTLGYSGDSGAATSAEIADPYGVAIDSSGNVYIADYLNARIRKVTASTGDISTIAGGGTVCGGAADAAGDGCAATNATLNSPLGVAVDSAGNIYIADAANQIVRKVTASTGIISVVAGTLGSSGYSGDGGLATSAQLSEPADVAVDSSGNIYIADSTNGVIRKVAASNSHISTVAGGGSGCIGQTDYVGDGCLATDGVIRLPEGVALDSAGNIYIADWGDDLIRGVSASTGIIYAVAGNLSGGYSGDGGAATSAELNGPYRLAVDSSGDIYISDNGNNVIREVVSTGDISTVVGNHTAGYSGDGGAATSAELHYPVGVALDGSANLYIGDADNNRIRAVGH